MKKTLCALIGATALSVGNIEYTQDTARNIETDLKEGKNVLDMITLPKNYAQKGEMKYNNNVWGKESKAVVHSYISTTGDDRIQIEASYAAPLDKMEDHEGVKQYHCNQKIYDDMFKKDTLRYITPKKGNCYIVVQNRMNDSTFSREDSARGEYILGKEDAKENPTTDDIANKLQKVYGMERM